jgi:FlaA1/EpsC-like NDP-sugar epimerase
MGSNGSVLTIWRDAIKNGQPLIVREPSPTRFFLKVEDAINLVMRALACMDDYDGGYIMAPNNLQAFSINDLAHYIAGSDYPIEYQELGSGEKQHEILVAPGEHMILPKRYSDLCLIESEEGTRVDETPDHMRSDKAPRMKPEEVIAKLGGAI